MEARWNATSPTASPPKGRPLATAVRGLSHGGFDLSKLGLEFVGEKGPMLLMGGLCRSTYVHLVTR